jgi:hypothetical protein
MGMNTLTQQILGEVKTYVGGLRFRALYNSLTHYEGNETLSEGEVKTVLLDLLSKRLLRRMSNGKFVEWREPQSRWEE